jgi:succinate dehydrogenase/fumarate reductase-like Fe-S protein
MKTVETNVGGISIVEVIMEESDFSTSHQIEHRMSICNSCEFIVNNESCSKCSCLLANRTKYVEMFCPEGKW